MSHKQETYQAIVDQLARDGYGKEAEAVRLAAMVQAEGEGEGSASKLNLELLVEDACRESAFLSATGAPAPASDASGASTTIEDASSSSLASLADDKRSIRASFDTVYTATHKDAVLCGAWSPDLRYCATGSLDTSIKVLDVTQLYVDPKEGPINTRNLPIRSYYEHTAPVTCLQFHPRAPVLLSASASGLILLYSYADGNRRAFSQFQDSHPINGAAFHPMGDWAAVAANHPLLRLYDVHSERMFVGGDPNAASHHGAITCVDWKANSLVTGAEDGHIRLWDLRESQVSPVDVLRGAHRSYPIQSLCLSGPATGHHYMLSGGGDGEPSLWDLRNTSRKVRTYSPPSSVRCTNASFAGSSDQWVVCGGSERYVHVFESSRSGSPSTLKGHSQAVNFTCSSQQRLLSCSQDGRARLWKLLPKEWEIDSSHPEGVFL